MTKRNKIIIGVAIFFGLAGIGKIINGSEKKAAKVEEEEYGPTAPVPDGFHPTIVRGSKNSAPAPTSNPNDNWCLSCAGTRKCTSCGGKGQYYGYNSYRQCGVCGGSGICANCHGTGIMPY